GLRHWVGVGVLALLAACATQVPEQKPAEKKDIISQPLDVPALEAITDTAERPLKGRFQSVTWGALPGWQEDDLQNILQGFINNCKGLVRPISGGLHHPARATPRDWQPVCAAAQRSGLDEHSGAAQAACQGFNPECAAPIQ